MISMIVVLIVVLMVLQFVLLCFYLMLLMLAELLFGTNCTIDLRLLLSRYLLVLMLLYMMLGRKHYSLGIQTGRTEEPIFHANRKTDTGSLNCMRTSVTVYMESSPSTGELSKLHLKHMGWTQATRVFRSWVAVWKYEVAFQVTRALNYDSVIHQISDFLTACLAMVVNFFEIHRKFSVSFY